LWPLFWPHQIEEYSQPLRTRRADKIEHGLEDM
jgi:hypothetical protein